MYVLNITIDFDDFANSRKIRDDKTDDIDTLFKSLFLSILSGAS